MPSTITPVYFFSSNIIYFGQKSPLNCNFLKFWVLESKFVKFFTSILNWLVNFFSNFASFFIIITYNFPVNFKLIHFLLWIKGPNKNPNFETLGCSGKNLPDSWRHFANHQSLFIQILHYSLVSWNIPPLYFFSSNIIYFGLKQPIKV